MTNLIKLQEITAGFSTRRYDQIDPKKTIKNNYVAEAFKDNLANDICNAWTKIDCTALHNELFVNLKNCNQILERFDIDGGLNYAK